MRGKVTLREVSPSPGRTADATVRIEPGSATDDARWVSMISWQGGEKLHLEHLEESAPGVYETNEPVPVDGTWKAMVRLHSGDSLLGLPIYLPADRAIPAEGVPATASFDRAFVDETEILQRELKDDVPGHLALIGYLTVGSIVLALLVLLGWVLRRLGGARGEPHRPDPAKTHGVGAREATA